MSEQGFAQFYSRRRQTMKDAPYKDTEFLYPHNEPWPERVPAGQAVRSQSPELPVSNIAQRRKRRHWPALQFSSSRLSFRAL